MLSSNIENNVSADLSQETELHINQVKLSISSNPEIKQIFNQLSEEERKI